MATTRLPDRATDRDNLTFEILAECSTTRARVSRMALPHGETALPTFMPVATQATMKGVTPSQILANDITLILNNTYHLSLRPGTDLLSACKGAHAFQAWPRNLLSDSGGFQMVSLAKLSQVTEEGVEFEDPHREGKRMRLTPEESIRIQHVIGTDIMMQLDDVIPSTTADEKRVAEATDRSVRWLDRCIAHHLSSPSPHHRQNLFAIIQGGLSPTLRLRCLHQMLHPDRAKHVAGFAVGGLSGGEEKDLFWRTVAVCVTGGRIEKRYLNEEEEGGDEVVEVQGLPRDKPRYCMGIGYAEDLLVAVALGIDMADCVFPTRTARFGVALTPDGPMNLKLPRYATDFDVIDPTCGCATCAYGEGQSRSFLNGVVRRETAGAHAVTIHNLAYQSSLMRSARWAILEDAFPSFLTTFFHRFFASPDQIPRWCVDALRSVGVDLFAGLGDDVRGVQGNGAKWEYSARRRRV